MQSLEEPGAAELLGSQDDEMTHPRAGREALAQGCSEIDIAIKVPNKAPPFIFFKRKQKAASFVTPFPHLHLCWENILLPLSLFLTYTSTL
jgi:hypothetical protein